MASQNPFPAPASTSGFQTIAGSCSESDAIHLVSGNLLKRLTLVSVSTIGSPLTFRMTYNSMAAIASSPVGNKWRHNYMMSLSIGGSSVVFTDASGRTYSFTLSGGSWVASGTSYYFAGSLVQNSTNWQITFPDGSAYTFDTSGNLLGISDNHGNLTTLQYISGVLVSVTEPTGRKLQLAYTGSFLTSVTDPNLNQNVLVYDTLNNNLTKVMGPGGCTTQYGYTTPSNALITSRTDPNGNVYSYGFDTSTGQLTSVTDAETPSHTISYAYDTVSEYIADSSATTQSFARTTLTDAFGNPWEYRFDQSGMLWRVIEPVDTTNGVYHWRRFFWDNNQRLLYSSSGYPYLTSQGSGTLAGPRDCPNNLAQRSATDPTLAVTTYHADASGKLSQMTYNSQRKLTSSYSGQAHYGVQGNWIGQYGTDGYLLCAFQAGPTDLQSLPSYVSSVSRGTATAQHLNWDTVYDHLMDPRALVSPTSMQRSCGFWESSSAFTVTVNLNTAKSFNLSFYTSSQDQAYNANNPLAYSEQMGREVTFTVTDMTGTQSYKVHNNAGGMWVTFPVQANASNPVTISIAPTGASTDARISAVMFDELDSRKTSYGYDPITTDPVMTTDSLGNTSTSFYNLDGTLSISTDANGNQTRYFYEDTHKNQTRTRDAYGNDTLRAYDANGNLVWGQDANGNQEFLTYDGKNRLLTATDALGNVVTKTYDSAGNLLTTTDQNGHQTQYTYTPTNRLKTATDAASQETQNVYDAGGNLYTVTDPNLNVTTYVYDNAQRVIQVTQADTTQVTSAYDAHGRLRATTSPNGNVANVNNINLTGAANLLLNPGAELLDVLQNANAAQGWNNQGTGQRDTSTSHSGNASLEMTTNTTSGSTYWSQKQLMLPSGVQGLSSYWARRDSSTDDASAQSGIVLRQVDGSTTEVQSPSFSLPHGNTTWMEAPLFRFTVPGDGQYATRPADEFRIYGNAATNTPNVWVDDTALYSLSTAMTYDAQGRLVATQMPDGTVGGTIYDRYGRAVQTIDPKGNAVVTNTYDSLGRVTTAADALGNTVSATYDAVGNKLSTTDPKGNQTLYQYDKLNRMTLITYPDGSTEQFRYDKVGNRIGYTNNRSQSYTFIFDATNRLVKSIYNTDQSTVLFGRDAVGNLITRVERNGDVCRYNYDAVNRLISVQRDPAAGYSSTTSWLQRSTYDSNSNRTEFDNGISGTGGVYGTAVYGTDTYEIPPAQWTVPGGDYDSMNRLTAYQDSSSNQTTYSYDVEGRLTSTTLPNGSPQLTVSSTYDIVGRLLSTNTVMGSTPILTLSNSYDLNSNRVGVTTGADTYDYDVDNTNQLIQEDINRFVERSTSRFQLGTVNGVDATTGALTLVALNDTFSGSLINCDRWRTAFSKADFMGFETRQNNGLQLVFPKGYTNTLATDAMNAVVTPPSLGYGIVNAAIFGGVEHRVQLSGNFDVQVDFTDFQGRPSGTAQNAQLTLMVSDEAMEPTLTSGPQNAVQMQIDATPQYTAIITIGGTGTTTSSSTTDTSGMLRITRTSSTTVTAYYWNGTAWQSLATHTGFISGNLYLSLYLNVDNAVGHGMFSDFQSNLSGSAYGTSGTYTSSVYDAGQSVTWNTVDFVASLPAGTAVELQVAVSSSPSGPFTYVGPDGTSATYFTSTGTAFNTGTTGRYATYQATLTGSGSATPTLSRVDLLFAGANTSTEYTYTYDSANNMTMKVTETPTSGGTIVTETRDHGIGWSSSDNINNLNQIVRNDINTVVTSPPSNTTVTWRYTYDASGNMLTKTDGTNLTTYTWDEDSRLTQVQLPGSVTVSYTYDVKGRLLTRTDSSGTANFVWDGMDCVQEADHSGNVTRYFVVNGILQSFDRTVSGVTSVYQVHSDAIGSVRKVTNSSGAVLATYDYDAWGNQLASTTDSIPNGGLQYRFVGAQGVRWDVATGLYYMRARWCTSALAKFLSQDSMKNKIDIFSNYYAYGANEPTIATDASGNVPQISLVEGGLQLISGWFMETNPESYVAVAIMTVKNAVTGATIGQAYLWGVPGGTQRNWGVWDPPAGIYLVTVSVAEVYCDGNSKVPSLNVPFGPYEVFVTFPGEG